LKGNSYAKEQLCPDGIFLLRNWNLGVSKLYIWIGEKNSFEQHCISFLEVVKFMRGNSLPQNTNVECCFEGFESQAFKREFSMWDTPIFFRHIYKNHIEGQ
jgi:hypothetical protein